MHITLRNIQLDNCHDNNMIRIHTLHVIQNIRSFIQIDRAIKTGKFWSISKFDFFGVLAMRLIEVNCYNVMFQTDSILLQVTRKLYHSSNKKNAIMDSLRSICMCRGIFEIYHTRKSIHNKDMWDNSNMNRCFLWYIILTCLEGVI